MKAMLTNLKRASADIILLTLLCEGDKYGYQMSQEIKKKTNNEFSILEGSMYTILYRLSQSGYVTYENRKVGERLTRVYYHITDAGREHLKEMIQAYKHYVSLINILITDDEEQL